MIKHITDYDGMSCYIIECDICKIRIASCIDFEYNKGQELVYSPILCESCGQKHNKDVGDDVFRLKKMEEIIFTSGYTSKEEEGFTFKYFVEDEDSK